MSDFQELLSILNEVLESGMRGEEKEITIALAAQTISRLNLSPKDGRRFLMGILHLLSLNDEGEFNELVI